MTTAMGSNSLLSKLGWVALAVLGAACLGVVALKRGEPVNAIWLVAAAVAILTIAYRFYSRYIADTALQLDPTRATPAWRRNDGLDFVPTNRWVLFGHHFAAIAGAGPLVGPVLAAQMGYLPGTLWILAGVVFAGAVQDMIILFCSTRRDGRSLGDMIRGELGNTAGTTAMIGILAIMIILLAVLALVVVKALAESPWGTFTVAATIPIAIFMGCYMRWLRPGKILEASLIGLVNRAVPREELDEAVLNEARRIAREQTELRVSVGARFATHWLLPRLPRFRAAHPAFELTFERLNTAMARAPRASHHSCQTPNETAENTR